MINNTSSPDTGKQFHSSLFDTVKVKVRVAHQNLYELRRLRPKRISWKDRQYRVRSKYGTFAIIASADGHQSLFIEASIPKFLTGQNLVGTEDLKQGAIELIAEVLRRARITPTQKEERAIRAGEFEMLRVDYANHLDCGGARRARAFMEALRRRTTARAWDYSAYKDETVYLRQSSSRSTLKAYDKGLELESHPLGPKVGSAAALTRLATGLVRFEFTLRADELKRLELRSPGAWSPEVARKLLDEEVRQLLPLEGKVPNLQLPDDFPRSLRDRLELWATGCFDAFTRYPGAIAQNKRVILERTGIDITMVLSAEDQAQLFVTLKEIFEMGWAFKSWEHKWKKKGGQG